MKYSKVVLNGVVESIDYAKRDLILTVTGEDNAIQKPVIHMWKTTADGDNPSWAGRYEWRDDVNVGTVLNILGHMGNNGRVIAHTINPAFMQRLNRAVLAGELIAVDDGSYQFLTKTPMGKDVHVYLDMNGVSVPPSGSDVRIAGEIVTGGKIKVNEILAHITAETPENSETEED